MSAEESKKLVLGFLDNLSAGKAEAALGVLSDSLTWWIAGNTPLSGSKNKQQLLEVLGHIGARTAGPVKITTTGVTAEGNRVAVEAESYGPMKNGKIYQNKYHFLFVTENGKIRTVKEYLDTEHVREVLCD